MPSILRNLSYSWLPKGTGEKGPGLFSNSNSHDAEPTYMKNLTNLVVKSGAWVATFKNTVYGNANNNVASLAIFNFYTGVAQTLTSKVIGHQPLSGTIRNITNAADIRSGMASVERVVFASIKNRLFMSNGGDTPIISADAMNYYPWGVNAPVTAPTYQTPLGALFTGTATVVGTTMTWNSGDKFPAFSPAIKVDVTFNGVIYPAGAVTWVSPTVLTVAGVAAGGPSTFVIGQTIYSGNTAVTNGSPNVGARTGGDPFKIGAINQFSPNNPIYFDNLIDATHKYIVGSVTDANNLVLTSNYNTTPAKTPVAYQVNTGPMSWINESSGYQYAYSYFDPTTGHVSTQSPVLDVSDGEPFNRAVGVNITNIITTANTRFTKIILFRSAKAGTDLQPIALLPNTGGPLSYLDRLVNDDSRGTDSWVGTGNPGKFIAPKENRPPPADLNHATYWDGRFWGSANSQVGILFFSARNDGVLHEINIGVGEESWPLTNTRNVPGSDGRITGLRVVGRNLFVLTDLSIYQVIGSSPTSYSLDKVTSRGAGTSHFATCEIPGSDINAGGDVLAYLGNDARVHFLFSNSGDYPQSYAIQGELDAALAGLTSKPKSTGANLGVLHTSDASYLVVQTFNAPLNVDSNTYLFDLDRKIWFRLAASDYPSACFVEGLLGGVLTALVGSWGYSNVYKFMDPANPTAPSGCEWTTHFINPPGLERKQYKDFQGLVVYTNEALALTGVNVYTDTMAVVPLTRVDAADQRISLLFGSDDDLAGAGMRAQIYIPQDKLVRGRVFETQVLWNPSSVGSKIQEVRALWTYEDATQSAGNI